MIEKLFKEKTQNIYIQFFRYFIVGGFATIIDFGFLLFFTEILKIYYLISAAFAFLIAVTFNYFLSIFWVFSKRKLKNKNAELGIFLIIASIGLILNEIIIWSLTEKFGIYYIFSKVIATAVILFWNFFARKIILF